MQAIMIRLAILILIGIIAWLLTRACRSFIEKQRRQALAAAPLHTFPISDSEVSNQAEVDHVPVRILAFSSADCRQCHQLQAPALRRVVEARGNDVTVVEVDATIESELVHTYHVLTVPSTVILDATGQAQAINYGFANTQRLLTQIDEVLAKNGQ
jgi:thioredoxin-like negative regulator of GroEL